MIKYKIELLLFIPFFAIILCYYISLSYKPDSAVAKPEKLYKEKMLMLLILMIIVWGIILLKINIPLLNIFKIDELIKI